MLCSNPYSNGQGMLYGCGQCMPCRINRRRLWTHRIMLEEKLHSESAFLTLTYMDDKLSLTSSGYATLNPLHLQGWLKRLRWEMRPSKIRYFAVGEYGDESERPHFHVALFNYKSCLRGRTLRRPGSDRPQWEKCCESCRVVGNTWGFGDIDAGTLNEQSAGYVCGYVTKKMTAKDDMRLNGRYPEFARMSLKPGIGADFIWDVASTLLEYDLELREDVPTELQHGMKKMPLGRYLTRKLRKSVGKDEAAPESVTEKIREELQPLREAAFDASRSFKETVVEANEQRRLNQASRLKVRKKGKVL